MIAHVLTTRTSKRTLAQLLATAISLAVIAIVLSGSASADLDTFTTGDGHEGPVVGVTSQVLNYSAPINATVATGATSLTTGAGQSGATGATGATAGGAQFEANRLALVIQSSNYGGTGATSGSQADIDLSSGATGRWELAKISSVSGSIGAGYTVNFSAPLINSYSSTGAQIVAVPEYTNVTLNAGASFKANKWTTTGANAAGGNGGIVAFLANGTVNLATSTSSISADASGFRGGAIWNGTGSVCTQLDGTVGGGKGEGIGTTVSGTTVNTPAAQVSNAFQGATAGTYSSRGNIANGGGGGDCENAGGGGGGNGGQGGLGGNSYGDNRVVGGLGGTKLNYSAFDHAIFGGGGGAGDENNDAGGAGGSGGGFVFVRANTLTGSGVLSATGATGSNSLLVGSSDGAGGGGAGGVVYARFNGAAACTSASVKGGAGGNEQSTGGVHGPGGGGAGGRLVLQSASGSCPTNVNNGAGGVTTVGSNPRNAGPTSATDATSSGATESVTGGGGLSAPTAAVSTPAAGAYVSSATPTITGTSSMVSGTIRVTVDGVYVTSVTTASNGTWSYTPSSSLTTGSHTYTVTPVYYGIAGSATASRTLIVDTTNPVVSITAPTAAYTTNTTQPVTFSISETNQGTTTCQIDSGTPVACTSVYTPASPMSQGAHTITVLHTDLAGRTGSANASFTVDNVAPSISLTAPANGASVSSTTPTVTYTRTEANPGANNQCVLDGGAPFYCTSGSALPVLGQGSHTLYVTHADLAGNVGTSATNTFTVDTIAPSAPSITTPSAATTFSNLTANTISGSAENNATVKIYDGATLIGTVTADGSGAWTYASTLAVGSHTITATATDAANNVSAASTAKTIIVDQTNPAAPSITTPSGATTYSATTAVTISGTAEANSTVKVLDGATQIGTATADGAGNWSYAATLASGSHSITATATDQAGNTGVASSPAKTIIVDTAAPTVTLSAPANGALISTLTPTVTYSVSDANPGATSFCVIDGASPVACTSGGTITVVGQGSHTVRVTNTDLAGNAGTSATNTFTVDTLAPSAPSITTPSATTTNTNLTANTIAGSAENNATVKIYDGATLIATVSANGSGAWTYAATLAVGSHTITATATDAANNVSVASSAKTIIVDQTAPAAPSITTPSAATTNTNLTANTIAGTAENNASVKIYDGASLIATVTADGSGNWTYAATLAVGSHTITATATDLAGNTGVASSAKTIIVDQTAPAAPSITTPSAATTYTNLTANTIAGTAENNASVKIYDGATLLTTVTADGSGNWTYAATLAVGSHSITATATDAAGNTGVASGAKTIIVDQTNPAAPSITTPSAAATYSATTAVTISGTAESNSTVKILDGVAQIGTATADGAGNWTYAATLASGSHSITATATDQAGNTGVASSPAKTVIVDTAAPTVTLSAPANGALVSTLSPTITYSVSDANAGATSYCIIDSGSPVACTSGGTITVVGQGSHTLRVTNTDLAGNVGTSATNTFTVDTVAPIAPSITTPSAATTYTNLTANTIAGSAENNASVKIYDGATLIATVSANGSGAWTYASTLAVGSHTITATATDAAGNTGVASGAKTIIVDQTAPAAPAITSPAAATTYSNLTANTISGTAENNASVKIFDGATQIGTATADGSGNWSYAATLAIGSHSITATATDLAGNTGVASGAKTIIVDQSAPSAPVILTPAAATTYSATTAVTISGTAEANSTVKILDGVTQIGTATTDGSGNWSYAATLGAGSHSITATATDQAGNNGVASSPAKTIVVDTTAPTVNLTAPANGALVNTLTPTITYSVTDANPGTTSFCVIDGGSPVACTSGGTITVVGQGSHTVRVTNTDLAGNAGTSATNTFTVDSLAPNAPSITTPATSPFNTNLTANTIAGSAENNATVKIYDGATLIATVSANGFGAWTYAATLAVGSHTITATATDAAGNTGTASPATTIVVDQTAPAAPSITTPAAATTNTNLTANTIAGTAEANSTVKILDGATQIGTATADGSGNWTYAATLAVGSHSITATATDLAGNTGAASSAKTIIVDQTAPSAPSITTPSAATTYTNSTASTIAGTAENNASVKIYDGATLLATVTANSSGAWTYAATLAVGSHSITATATDLAGNTGVASGSKTIIVDQTAPAAPSITTPSAATSYSASTAVTIAGTAENNASVKIYDGATLITTVTADGSGNWTYAATLAAGSHSITATATDQAGNTGVASSPAKSIVVDTTAPTVTLSVPANGALVNSLTPAITYSVSDTNPGASSFCIIDSGSPVACTSGSTITVVGQGSHTLRVTNTDLAGNVGTSATSTFTVDSIAPVAPSITTPSAATTYTNLTANTIAGTAENNASVKIYDGATLLTTVSANGSGAWTYASTLAVGSHTITATATDAAGNTGVASSTKTIIVDQTAPAAPSITTPSAATTYSSTTAVTIAGTAEANSTVKVLDGATQIGTATTDGAGNWTYAATLASGSHSITATATDLAGNTGVSSSPAKTVVVDTAAPAVSLTAPANGALINTLTPTVTFSVTDANPGATSFCVIDSGSPIACTSGSTITLVGQGSHTLRVTNTDLAGNAGTSATNTFTVDSIAPVAPSITTPSAATTYTNVTANTIAGSAENNASVKIYDGATLLTTVTANGSGAWTYASTLAVGSHTITATATDTAGNTSSASGAKTIIVDQAAPAAPSITSPSAATTYSSTTSVTVSGTAEANSTVKVLDGATQIGSATTDGAGNWTYAATLATGSHSITATATDLAGNTGVASSPAKTVIVDTAAPTVTLSAPANGALRNTLTPTVTYSVTDANPGSTSFCIIDGGSPIACSSGSAITLVGQGSHTLRVTNTDLAGNIGTSATNTFTVDTIAPIAPTITTPPSATTYSNLTANTIAGNSESNASVKIYDGATLLTTVTANGSGAWTYASTLAVGSHTITATATDAAGNTGPASSAKTIIVDQTAPAAPSITTPSAATTTTSSTTNTIAGTAENNSTVKIYDGAVVLAVVNADGSGNWTYAATLAEGSHTITATATDLASNTSVASSAKTIVVDTTAPAAPAITSPTGSPAYSATATPTVSGTAEAGSSVRIYDGATLIGTVTATGGTWTFPVPTLSSGTHAITATATDVAGNTGPASSAQTIVVDTTAPTVAISAPASGSFGSSTTPSVSFSVTDANPSASSECKVDAGSFVSCTTGYSTPTLTSGSHTVTVRHTDLAGNVGSSSTTFTVDNLAPTVTILGPTEGQYTPDSSVGVYFEILDDNASATSSCSVDSGPATSCTSPFTTASLSDGPHSVSVSHTDQAGNTATATSNFIVDTDAPNPPVITGKPANPSGSTDAEFTFTGDEVGARFTCSIDGSGGSTCSSPIDYSSLAEGSHQFIIWQIDLAGNATATSYSWVVDTTPPAAPTVNGPNAHTNNPESTVSYAGSPDTVELRCSFNGGAYAPCATSPLSLGELPDGNYTFAVQAYDAAGNSSTSTISWEIDTVAPGAPTITSGPTGSVPSPDAEFAFTGAEPGGIFRCSIDSQPAVTCTSPFDVPGLSDGTYTFRVRQVDAAGNPGPQSTRTWTVDTTPPATPSVGGPASPSGQTSATINFSDSESGVTFQCQVDGGSYAPCVDPLSLTGLSDGPHTVNVRAYDDAGNGSAPGTFTWTVDHTLFTADISGAPSGVVNSTTASMTLSASLPGSTFQCSLDGAGFTPCNSPVGLSGLTEGTHTFKLHASNGPDNAPEVTRTWTVDLTNPSVTITSPLAASTTAPDTSVTFTTNDLNAPIVTTCKLDGASAAPCSSPQPYTNLSEGNHTVVVTATDAGGNSGSAAVTWHVDHTAPSAPLITEPASTIFTNDTTPTVSGTAEAGSTLKLYAGATLLDTITVAGDGTWTWTPPAPLTQATYHFHATATDSYGNESADSETRIVAIDTEAPDAPTLTAPSSGLTNDSTPLVKGTAETQSKVTVYVDGQPIAGIADFVPDGTWELLISPALSDGPHTITAVATDQAGNVSPASSDLNIVVDTAAPSVSVTAPTAGQHISDATPDVTFTAESGATTRCKVDDGAFVACSSPFTVSTLTEGSHTVTVEATDNAGNAATAVVTFTVDLTDPTAQITGGPADGDKSNDDTPTFTFTKNETGTFECSIDGGTFVACSSPFTLPALGDGTHSFSVHAIDQADNVSDDVTRSWTVDTTAPDAPSIDNPADNAAVAVAKPTVTGDAGSAEAGATLSVYINGTLNGTTTVDLDGSWSYTAASNLSDNVYAFTAKATDAAGNVSAVSNTVHIRVDVANPTAQITAKPGALSNDSTPTFSFTADEPSSFECNIDGGAYAGCSSPFTSGALADGPHKFFVRAIDASGNQSTPVEWDWTTDTTAPDVTITPNSPAAGLSPTFSFSSNENPGTTYKCRIDTGALQTCTSPFSAPTLPAGTHTLEVQFTDAAGNTGTKTTQFTVEAVSSPPVSNPPTNNPPIVTPPTAQTCTGSGDEPGIPANITVISAVAKKNVIKFTTSSDKYILIRISIYNGTKLVGTAVRANNPGKRLVAIKTKKALPKNKKFTIRLSAITMTGGKSVAGTNMVTDKTGKTTLVGADGKVGAPAVGTVDCNPEKGAKKIKVKIASAVNVKINSKKLSATATASDWTVATVRIIQNGKTVGRKVYLLQPNKKLRASVKLLPGKTLVKGKAVIQVATCTVDGVWQLFKKPITVK
jgi:hypothetical protein